MRGCDGSQRENRPALRSPAVDHAVTGMAQEIELTVRVPEIQRDGAGAAGRRAPDLGKLELDAIGDIDPDPVRLSADGAPDRRADRLQHAGYHDARRSGLNVDFAFDRLEERRMDSVRHGAKYPPVGRGFVGFLAVQDLCQRVTLCGVRALVDDGLQLALAFEDGAGPAVGHGALEPVELYVGEMTLVDPQGFEAAAVSVRGQRLELTRATVRAVAIAEGDTFHIPIDAHDEPPGRIQGR